MDYILSNTSHATLVSSDTVTSNYHFSVCSWAHQQTSDHPGRCCSCQYPAHLLKVYLGIHQKVKATPSPYFFFVKIQLKPTDSENSGTITTLTTGKNTAQKHS